MLLLIGKSLTEKEISLIVLDFCINAYPAVTIKHSFSHSFKRERERERERERVLGVVIYICNPSYLGGRDQEDHGLRSCKKLARPHLNKKTGYGGSVIFVSERCNSIW
jgi:hypothetical protein